jgi:hypothetical protein
MLCVAMALGCSSEGTSARDPGTGGGGGASASSSSNAGAVSVGSTGAGGSLPDTFTVEGVVTDGAAPLAGAMVLQGGGTPAMITGPDGAFTIQLTRAIPGTPTVVAAKEGYRSAGVEMLALPEGPITLVLREAAPPDNTSYVYGAPGTGDPVKDDSTAYCGHCHTAMVALFQQSAHARATKDPLVQDLYAGVSRAHTDAASCAGAGGIFRAGRDPGTAAGVIEKCYLGAGVLPDLNGCGAKGALACDDPALPADVRPKAFGRCADCHAAGMGGKAGGRDLLDAVGLAYQDGNHCDACHKVRDVDLSQPPGLGGALVLQRPSETGPDGIKPRQVMFGPLPDVPNDFMGGSYQPKFSTAVFCAGCHQMKQEALLPGAALDPQRFPEGLPVHDTYAEWKASAYGTDATPCQHCHMPPLDGLANTVDKATPAQMGLTFGFARPPEQIRSHLFRGPLAGSPRLVDLALGLWVSTAVQNGKLQATVTLRNQGAGHALPTGEPMRALLLLVRAEACGALLPAIGGMTVPDTGGAWAEGVVGQGVVAAGTSWTWATGAAVAQPGEVLRAVRDTGAYDDYPGIGLFQGLPAAQKGIPVRAPVGEARVVKVSGDVLELSAPIAAQPGDRIFLGDALAALPADGAASLALAGSAGHAFAKVLLDPGGARGVPHHRAVDMASDNRLPPLATVTTTHSFTLPANCPSATVSVAAVYRPVPVGLARERGWEARDWVAATTKEILLLP